MTSNNYWEARDVAERERWLNREIARLNKELKRGYTEAAKRLIIQIKALYNRCSSVNDLYLENRYYNLLNDIDKQLTKLGVKQEDLFSRSLNTAYYQTTKLVDNQFPHSMPLNPQLIEKAVNGVWCTDGKVWSDRLWANKDKLKDALSKTLIDALSTGHVSTETVMKDMYGQSLDTYNQALKDNKGNKDLTQQLKKNFSAAYSNCKRLVVTELAHVQNEATLDRYKAAGVEKVRILTYDDAPDTTKRDDKSEVCEHCKEYEGKIYDINDCPILPEHPNCRCCYVAYFGDDKPIKYSLSKGE